MTPPRLRVASDVGGTFTDNLPYDEAARHVTAAKVPTTPENRALGTVRGLRQARSEEHTSELQSQSNLVCRLLLEKKKHASARSSGSSRYSRLGGRSSRSPRLPRASSHPPCCSPRLCLPGLGRSSTCTFQLPS